MYYLSNTIISFVDVTMGRDKKLFNSVITKVLSSYKAHFNNAIIQHKDKNSDINIYLLYKVKDFHLAVWFLPNCKHMECYLKTTAPVITKNSCKILLADVPPQPNSRDLGGVQKGRAQQSKRRPHHQRATRTRPRLRLCLLQRSRVAGQRRIACPPRARWKRRVPLSSPGRNQPATQSSR